MKKKKDVIYKGPRNDFEYDDDDNDDMELMELNNGNSKDDEINFEIKQNEICLRCQENEEDWIRAKSSYKIIELSFFLIGLLLTCSSLGFSIWLLFFSSYQDIKEVLKFLDSIKLIYATYWLVSASIFIFLIEIISLLLDIVKLIEIAIIFKVLNSEKDIRKSYNNNSTHENEILLLYPDQSINQIIDGLRSRISIRNKFALILKSLNRLEIFLNIYFVLIVIIPKVAVAIVIFLNVFTPVFQVYNSGSMNDVSNVTVPFNLINSNTNIDESIYQGTKNFPIPSLSNQFVCCQQDQDLNNTVKNNIDATVLDCKFADLDIECFKQLNFNYVLLILIFLLASSLIKIIIQIVLNVNLRVNLIRRLIRKPKLAEDKLYRKYDACKRRLLHKRINENREQNEQMLANKFETLTKNKRDNARSAINSSINNGLYVNEDGSLNEDVKEAIGLIEKVNIQNEDKEFFPYSYNYNNNGTNTFKKNNIKQKY